MSPADPPAVGRDRRSFYRVLTRIPLRVRGLDLLEAEQIAARIAIVGDEPPEIEDPAVAAAMARVERKLDRILAALDSNHPRPLTIENLVDISISGAGVALRSEEPLEGEGPVLVELQLPGSPSRDVMALAQVVREPEELPRLGDGKGAVLALSFGCIRESDREAIVRFSYDVQRFQLRERASGGHSA